MGLSAPPFGPDCAGLFLRAAMPTGQYACREKQGPLASLGERGSQTFLFGVTGICDPSPPCCKCASLPAAVGKGRWGFWSLPQCHCPCYQRSPGEVCRGAVGWQTWCCSKMSSSLLPLRAQRLGLALCLLLPPSKPGTLNGEVTCPEPTCW